MKKAMNILTTLVIVFGLTVLGTVAPNNAAAITQYCGRGAAIPPFLGGGVDPNLLLMLDNSASMLDLAYVTVDDPTTATNEAKTCYDDTYDVTNATTYAGYFDPTTWYSYDFTNSQFVEITDPTPCDAAYEYTSSYLCIDGTITPTLVGDELTAVTTINVLGNLLNWAASSKLDIQKDILTGGKYDSTAQQLKMETRGCGDRRFIKKVPVAYGATTHYVTFGVRPPQAPEYDDWQDNTAYSTGDIVADFGTNLYIATSNGTSDGSAVTNDSGVNWAPYWGTRWHNLSTYNEGDLVTDPSKNNTVDEGRVYVALNDGTASGTGVDDDNNIEWVPYDLTHIDIFVGNATGFNNSRCQDAIDILGEANPSQGQLFQAIDDCMGSQRAGGASGTTDANNAFNHGIHNCWYRVKQGDWQPGAGPEVSMKNACEAIYESGINPWELDPGDRAYVCYGQNPGGAADVPPAEDISDDVGYVGRCWLTGGGGGAYTGTWRCTKAGDTYPADCPDANKQEFVYLDAFGNEPPDYARNTAYVIGDIVLDRYGEPWTATTAGTSNANFLADDTGVNWSLYGRGWTATSEGYGDWDLPITDDTNPQYPYGQYGIATPGTLDDCIRWAMADYCSSVEVPEVIDPSDQVGAATGATDETWGLPAILTDSGVLAQLDEPIATMLGFIETTTAPEGLVQEFAGDIRMGAMVFNDSGTASECNQTDPFVLYDCAAANNQDGGQVIAEIDQSDAHTADLVEAINDFKATSWTPLAEAFYNAIGYFKQDTAIRLNTDDFDTTTSPIEYWCQNNNVLIITEGSSTADLNPDVYAFAQTSGQNDTDTDTDTTIAGVDCGVLDGSTLLDDLTYYVHHTDGVLGQLEGENIRNIDTHIVVAGTAREDTGASPAECSPSELLTSAASNGGTTLVTASNPQAMQDAIRNAFSSIRAGAAAGSAASVISASRGGEGAAYQAIFWQDLTDSAGTPNEIRWAGEVHALLVDEVGNLYEDTAGSAVEDGLDAGDKRVAFFFDENLQRTRVCDGTVDNNATCTGTVRELDDVDYLWSAVGWLGQITDGDIIDNREVSLTSNTGQYISDTPKRQIFTWNDLDADGIVDDTEILHFEAGQDWENMAVNSTDATADDYRAPVPYDFGVTTNAEVDDIVNWIRGLDTPGTYRSRQFQYNYSGNGETLGTWRLGDVVHSTPISVAAPAEGFQFLYRDITYSDFVQRYKNRRHMIYYGGNDGLLHAANGGFYSESDRKFCKTADCSGAAGAPALGAEMWAYAPYNLLPHLKCLMDENYGDGVSHKYFVDLRTRIFDVRIFNEDPPTGTHPNGWGTILVGGMRFGGAKVDAAELDLDGDGSPDYPDDTRQFTSAWFIFDITDPENPPELLAEFTRTTDATDNHVDLAYTFAIPTLVTMKYDSDLSDSIDNASDHDWYLILGSGPTDVDGTSTQNAKLAVIDLQDLKDKSAPFRIEDVAPNNTTEKGTYTLEANGWVSDLITVDFDLDENYMADAVYFGTIAGDYYDDVNDTGGWGGAMYRLVTRKADSDGNQIKTEPHEWADLLTAQPTATGPNPKKLIDLGDLSGDNPGISLSIGQPISASPSAGTDGKNFWIYFGTGRFIYDDDKIDTASNAQNTFYGIKEPILYSDASGSCVAEFTWETVEYSGNQNTTPGSQGLVRADEILVTASDTGDTATLSCEGGGSGCFPDPDVDTFAELQDWIAGTGFGCGAGDSYGTDGWYRNFPRARERNLGQGTLLGGLMTYTTFQPYSSVCQSEGLAFLYGVFYQTGTAYFEPVFITDTDDGIDDSGNVKTTVDLGRGLASTPNLHVGKQEGAKAFVQTSTGTIVEVPQPNLPIKGKTARHSWEVVR